MDEYQHLLQFLSRCTSLTEPEIQKISSRFGLLELKKEEYYLQAGACCCYLNFLVEGVLGFFLPSGEGEEKVSYFVTGRHFFTDPDSFYPGQPSCGSYRAVVSCSLLSISSAEAALLIREFPCLIQVFQQIHIESLTHIVKSQQFILSGDPASCYHQLLTHQRELIRQVPLKYIASYLKITQSTLSHIRGKVR